MTQKFSAYSDAELLALTNEQLNDAIRIEAIDRGIKPPITISEALRRSEWRGYQKPAEAISVWRFSESYHKSDFGYLDKATAERAAEGLVRIESSGYPSRATKITSGEICIEQVWIGVSAGDQKAAKFTEFFEDETEFNNVRDECLEKFSAVRQAAYDKRVNSEKRAEYLRLAGGNEEIASAFWAKTHGKPWPTE